MNRRDVALFIVSLVLTAVLFSCVLELTWAPVHDAPNEVHLHASAAPTQLPTASYTSEPTLGTP